MHRSSCSSLSWFTCTRFGVQTGTQISRRSRKIHAPKRPEKGYSLVVRALDKKDEEGQPKTYVAQPGGRQRNLNDSERLFLDRQRPKPRRRVI